MCPTEMTRHGFNRTEGSRAPNNCLFTKALVSLAKEKKA